jgi:hypothetical protein
MSKTRELTGLESCWECKHYQDKNYNKCPCINFKHFERAEEVPSKK